MNITELLKLDREPALPVYLMTPPDGGGTTADFEPGRIFNYGYYDKTTGRIDRSVLEQLGPQDVFYVPLFRGEMIPEGVIASMGTDAERLPMFEENLSIIAEVGPRVRAIIVGNAGSELTFKDAWVKGLLAKRSQIIDLMCDFVERMAGLLADRGARPALCPVDWDVAIDCYFGEGKYRDLANSLGAVQICCCGFQLFGLGSRIGYPIVPHPSDQYYWKTCPIREQDPWPRLTDYLRGTDMWSGVEFRQGLVKGNDIRLAEHGFTGGMVGVYATEEDILR